MVNLKGLLLRQEVLDKGTPSPPFCFFYARKGCMVLSNKLQIMGTLLALHFVDEGRNSLTYFLQTIAFCFAKQSLVNVTRWWTSFPNIKVCLVRRWIRIKLHSFLVGQLTKDQGRLLKIFWGVREEHNYEKYLGLSSLIGRRKRASFNYIKERVWRKLQGWERKLLSQAGREVLIK